jgi:hypothetical protein
MSVSKECLLYSSDLEAFVGLSVKILETTSTEELRFYILSVLEKITVYDDYYKSKYKFDELYEILENYMESTDVCDENKNIASKVFENMKLHQ